MTAASSGPSPLGTTGPTPLYNSQVRPYAVLTGPYGYIARGAAIRDQGYGLINLTWPGGSSNLVAAYMVWSILDNGVPADNGTLNGHNVSGTWAAYATPSPCWSPTFIYAFVADVTPYVLNGTNNLTGFPSGVTDGVSPWVAPQIVPMAEGVSLIAVYGSGLSTLQQVTVFVGAQTTSGYATLTDQLNYSTTDAGAAKTTYIMADGQLPGNVAVWNGSILDPDAFPGSDPKETTNYWSEGNLSDTKTYNVTVSVGSNNTTASMYPTEGDCLTWVGQVLSVGVPGAPPPYAVVFEEQGLANGTSWSVTTDSSTESGTVADATGSLTFDLGNGSYTYSVPSIPGYFGPPNGAYKVDGGPVFIRLLFHQVLYGVSVFESGLPIGYFWWAAVTNLTEGISYNTTVEVGENVTYLLGNGTYTYSDGDVGLYLAHTPEGSLVVAGANVTITVDFVPPPLFDVTFVEHGLPGGTAWGGDLYSNFGTYSPDTTAASFSVMLPNASADTDGFFASTPVGFVAPPEIDFGVFGTAESFDVNYTPLYDVSFTETGLPTGTEWTGSLFNASTGTSYAYSFTPDLNFSEANGSYQFTVDPVWGYIAEPATGYVTVVGANVSLAIKFVPAPTYFLNFTETGLPRGTTWGVELELPNDTDLVRSAATSTISFSEPNGSYYFVVSEKGPYLPDPSSGYVEIDGAPVVEPIVFNASFTVTFTETGLPTGTSWYVEMGEAFNTSTGPDVNFTEINASYSFSVYSIESYTPSPASGSVVVNGANVTEAIVFSSLTAPTYNVEFTESGLPADSDWFVTLVELTLTTPHPSVNFTEPNGTYEFSVEGPTGYTPSPASGSVEVSGAPVSEEITFTAVSTSYDVTFSETGLPTGTSWYVTLGESPGYGMGSTIVIPETDGTYPFTASSPGYEADPASGSITVEGSSVTQPVAFAKAVAPTFALTFVEQGLPSGTTWWVNITGESPLDSSQSTVSISLANGSYTYRATADNRAFGALAGTAVVKGATSVTLLFAKSQSSAGTGFLGLPGNDGYYALGGVGGLAAFALLLALLAAGRRRKKKQDVLGPPPSGGPMGAPPPTPPRTQ